MAAADYSVRNTDIGETQNFVSPQQGIKDESLAAIIGGAGTAAMMGVETYATAKGKEFAKDYQAMTDVGLGIANPASEEEKQFQDKMNRIQQTAQIGRVDTAKVLKEEFLRKSIADRPWMSKRYQEMAGRVDSRYNDLVSVLEKDEARQTANLSAQAKAEAERTKSQIKRLERLGEDVGWTPKGADGNFKPWESMTRSERDFNEYNIQERSHMKTLLLAGRGDAEFAEGREKMNFSRNAEGRAQTAEGRARFNFSQTVADQRGQDIANAALAHQTTVISAGMTEWLLKNPGASKEQTLQAASALISKAVDSHRNNLLQLGTEPGVSITPAVVDASTSTLASTLQSYVDSVTGPGSNAAVQAREYKNMQNNSGMNAYKLLPIQSLLRDSGINFSVQNMTDLTAILGTDQGADVANKATTDLQGALKLVLDHPEQVYTPTGTTTDIGVQAISTNILVDSFKSGSPAYKALLGNPASYIKLIPSAAAALSAEPDPDNQDKIFGAITNPDMLAALDKADPRDAQQAYDSISKAIKTRAASVIKPESAGELVQSFDPVTKQFIPIPNNNVAKLYTNMANTAYKTAETIEMKVNGDADPDRLVRSYFSPQLADKLFTKQEQPQ